MFEQNKEQQSVASQERRDNEKTALDIEKARSEVESKKFDERIQLIDVAQNLAVHPESALLVAPLIRPAMQNVMEDDQIPSGLVPRK